MMALAHFCSMVHLHSFCVLAAFFSHYVSVSLAFASLPHECLLGSFTPHYTHTSQSGPRAMSRNTKQAMLDRIDRKRKRGDKGKCKLYLRCVGGDEHATCDDGGGGGGRRWC